MLHGILLAGFTSLSITIVPNRAVVVKCGEWNEFIPAEHSITRVLSCLEQLQGKLQALWPGTSIPDSNLLIVAASSAAVVEPDSMLYRLIHKGINREGSLGRRRVYFFSGDVRAILLLLRRYRSSTPYRYFAISAHRAAFGRALEGILHEEFHRYQVKSFKTFRTRFWGSKPQEQARANSSEFIGLAGLEAHLVAATLGTNELRTSRCLLSHYLSIRSMRTAGDDQLRFMEEDHERIEGTAQYVGIVGAASALGITPDSVNSRLQKAVVAARPGRARYYHTGAALAALLDRARAPWQIAVQRGATLDELVAKTYKVRAEHRLSAEQYLRMPITQIQQECSA